MKISLGKGSIAKDRSPTVAILMTSNDLSPDGLPKAWLTALRPALKAKHFSARKLESLSVYADGQRLCFVGLGPDDGLEPETFRRAGAAAALRAAAPQPGRLAVVLSVINRLTAEVAMQAVAEGLVLGAYEFHGEKTEAADKKPVRTTTVFYQGRTSAACSKALRTGQVVAESQCFARDLGNQPGNIATPRFLAAQARRLAKEGPLRCKVLSKAELVKKKYGGVLAVAAGSAEPPVFIELEYRPARAKKSVCLVGKGLSFDSGGISLKPPAGMEEMKFDMCGGAAVLGAMRAVAALKPPVRVHGLIPSSENMPGSRAIKPGDVFKTYGGISVEVINTDAEGRLILADALGRAQELKADYTIDLATLTGACVVALGHRATGLFCAHDDLSQHLTDAGEQAGERLWPLPLWGEFRDELKSMVADIKNSGSRWGGAVTAAAFLQKFAGDLNWAHLDIAGTAWDTPKTEYYAKGATGVGVRTLVQFIQSLA